MGLPLLVQNCDAVAVVLKLLLVLSKPLLHSLGDVLKPLDLPLVFVDHRQSVSVPMLQLHCLRLGIVFYDLLLVADLLQLACELPDLAFE